MVARVAFIEDLTRQMSRAARRHYPARLRLRRLRLVVRQHRSAGPARMRDISRNHSPGSISSATSLAELIVRTSATSETPGTMRERV